jgi:hypothetical protein
MTMIDGRPMDVAMTETIQLSEGEGTKWRRLSSEDRSLLGEGSWCPYKMAPSAFLFATSGTNILLSSVTNL